MRTSWVALLTAVAALAAPTSAHALSTAVDDVGVLRIADDRGAHDGLALIPMPGDGEVQIRDVLKPNLGNGCVYDDRGLICSGVRAIDVSLGIGDDRLTIDHSLPMPVRYAGGAGRRDQVWIGQASDFPITGGMVFDNDGVADDGPRRNFDVEPDVEVLEGTLLADTLGSGARGASIRPREGDDLVRGSSGPDRITAAFVEDTGTDTGAFYDEGSDTIKCGGGQDFVLHDSTDKVARDCEAVGRPTPEDPDRYYLFRGSNGDDFMGAPYGWDDARMYGFGGDDTVQPPDTGKNLIVLGSGNDRTLESGNAGNTVQAGSGNDFIDMFDGSTTAYGRDKIDCGRGRDRVYADRQDRVARNCERVFRRSSRRR